MSFFDKVNLDLIVVALGGRSVPELLCEFLGFCEAP